MSSMTECIRFDPRCAPTVYLVSNDGLTVFDIA